MKAGAISFNSAERNNSAKKFAALALCLVMALAFMMPLTAPLTAHADESTKTVRVGWYDSPYNRMDEAGRKTGYAYEYQRKIAAYTGWTYEYVTDSWAGLMDKLVSGEIYAPKSVDGRREADLMYGYIHPCCSFPLSDVTIEVPPVAK